MLTGKKNNHFELNAGGFITEKESPVPILTLGIVFKYQRGGLIFRANTGIITLGISLGYAF